MTLTLVDEFLTAGMGWNRKIRCDSKYSKTNYRNHLKQFGVFLEKREKTIQNVDEDDIRDYITDMQQRGFKPNTIAVKMAALSSYFRWMKHKEIITHHPHIKTQPHCTVTHKKVPDEVVNALFHKISGDDDKEIRDSAMIALIALCGFQTEKVVALNIGDVDLTNKTIKGKPIDEIYFKITRHTLRRNAQNDDEPLFVNRSQGRISARSLRRHLCKYMDDLNQSDYSTRDLQYTYRCKQGQFA